MSYILEALKKAEAERHTGVQQAATMVPGFGPTQVSRSRERKQWALVAVPLAAVLLVAALWLGLRGEPAASDAVVASAAPATTAIATMPAAPVPSVQAPSPQQPARSDSAREAPAKPRVARVEKQTAKQVQKTAEMPVESAAEPPAGKSVKAAPEKTIEKPVRKPVEKKRAPESVDTRTARAAATSPEPPLPTLPTLRELPEQVQHEVPPYKLGGYIYSGNRTDRSVLVNNRLLREGDEIAPGLLLEQMMPNGMVLNYRGHRFRASY